MKQFRLDNSPIVYYTGGKNSGEWILFIHAAFAEHKMFQAQFQYFGDKYRLLAVDIIGHGQSTDTQKGDSITNMSAWIDAILKAESIGKVHLVGVSLGAVLAQDFANRYPNSVKSLACFGGYDINHFDTQLQKANGKAQILLMIKALFSVKWFAKANREISAYTPEAQNAFYEMNLRFPKKSFLYFADLNKMVNTMESQNRGYPLLIGCGRHDIPMELEAIEMWRQSEPDCNVILFEGAGHLVNMDVPQEFCTVMEKFWAQA